MACPWAANSRQAPNPLPSLSAPARTPAPLNFQAPIYSDCRFKGWLDADGNTHEQVIDVAGNADNGAGVDPQSCAAIGSGERNLCTVWRDPNYKASQKAFYYVRVLENPTCRWSTLQCQSYGVNPFDKNCKAQADAQTAFFQDERGAIGDVFGRCCLNPEEERFYSPIIQERAWTSPIWINPGS